MNVRHIIELHPRCILLSELRVFFIRPWCSQPGSPSGEPTLSERKSPLAGLAGNRVIYAPLDHLNVLGEPAFDYSVSGSE
jgi:hypothetical protein